MDKCPWDSNAVFIFFCHFWVSSWNSASLACEQALGFGKGWKKINLTLPSSPLDWRPIHRLCRRLCILFEIVLQFKHDCRMVCLVFQIPDYPTILISLGSSQFCLKIPNLDQYSIGTGKNLIVTSVVINKPEQLPQAVLNWNWFPENLDILPEV